MLGKTNAGAGSDGELFSISYDVTLGGGMDMSGPAKAYAGEKVEVIASSRGIRIVAEDGTYIPAQKKLKQEHQKCI